MSHASPHIALTLNGASRRVPAGTTVADLVECFGVEGRGVAVAIDREVVPRSAWQRTEVPAGANVEVVGAAPGG